MRTLLIYAAAAIVFAALYYLYQKQLGAVSFFLLSIFSFYLTYKQISKRKKTGEESEKSGEEDR